MNQKTFAQFSGAIFLLIAVLHAFRIFSGWEAVIGGFEVPMWLSWLALVIAGYLAWTGLKLAR